MSSQAPSSHQWHWNLKHTHIIILRNMLRKYYVHALPQRRISPAVSHKNPPPLVAAGWQIKCRLNRTDSLHTFPSRWIWGTSESEGSACRMVLLCREGDGKFLLNIKLQLFSIKVTVWIKIMLFNWTICQLLSFNWKAYQFLDKKDSCIEYSK